MSIYEFDEESYKENLKKDYFDMGVEQGIERGIEQGATRKLYQLVIKKLLKGNSPEDIADALEENESKISEICKLAQDVGYDVDKMMALVNTV